MAEERLTMLWEGLKLTEEEEQVVLLYDQSLQEAYWKGKHCLMSLVTSDKPINIEAFKKTMALVWRLEGWVEFLVTSDNSFFIEFQMLVDKEKVLKGRLWTFDRFLVALQEVDGSLPFNAISFTHESFWVQLHNMPLLGMNQEYGKLVASAIGNVLFVEVKEDGMGWGRSLRVKAEVNLTKALVRGRWVQGGDQRTWIAFKYERLQNFCFKCGVLKHKGKSCPLMHRDDGEAIQFGPWLRATPSKTRLSESRKYGGDGSFD
ncbi:uncharacterized protein LOC121253347 [Juglans microcarpa x Juglans regia]|uniref:uncharacterized protein LOC121253347 n=1 Tax=Juglans microcarpa x Juglans regia TaxID=2249226 RepID=UPI001B7E90A9|nr:uncharacterized protein LOC121253347 [Juglans microcarpa x Juglans regia]